MQLGFTWWCAIHFRRITDSPTKKIELLLLCELNVVMDELQELVTFST